MDPDRASSERLAQIVTPGWAVALAGSRREAWALIKIHVPDLVVTELDLADASGLDFVRELRAHPETRSTLLLVLTTRRSQHDKIACLLSGADAYLVKPVSPSQFDLQVKLLTRFYQVVEELPSHYGGSGETR